MLVYSVCFHSFVMKLSQLVTILCHDWAQNCVTIGHELVTIGHNFLFLSDLMSGITYCVNPSRCAIVRALKVFGLCLPKRHVPLSLNHGLFCILYSLEYL